MATESDKTNNGVVLTALLMGAAAMAAGSAALVSMARAEMREASETLGAYADEATVRELIDTQRAALRSAPLPIDKAEQQVLAAIKADPNAASPETAQKAAAPAATAETPTVPSEAGVTPEGEEAGAPSADGSEPAETSAGAGPSEHSEH